jgi:hypothetical protein
LLVVRLVEPVLTYIVSLSLCGILERLAAVGFEALVGRAKLGGVLSTLSVLAWRLSALSGA